jgi:hypothetical protein
MSWQQAGIYPRPHHLQFHYFQLFVLEEEDFGEVAGELVLPFCDR